MKSVAAIANEIARGSRRAGAPVLTETSTRETLIAWLQWCDPNGSHTDALALVEGCESYTLATAWEAVAAMLEGC